MSEPLVPMAPQQVYVVSLIATYLKDRVDDPEQAALEIWRLTRTKLRPVVARNS